MSTPGHNPLFRGASIITEALDSSSSQNLLTQSRHRTSFHGSNNTVKHNNSPPSLPRDYNRTPTRTITSWSQRTGNAQTEKYEGKDTSQLALGSSSTFAIHWRAYCLPTKHNGRAKLEQTKQKKIDMQINIQGVKINLQEKSPNGNKKRVQ